jgi:hypothetical protein
MSEFQRLQIFLAHIFEKSGFQVNFNRNMNLAGGF